MSTAMSRAAVALTAAVLFGGSPKATPGPQTRELLALHWSVHPQRLAASDSTLVLPARTIAVQGSDAKTFDKIINGDSNSDSEAIVQDTLGDYVALAYNSSGYVTVDDWTSVDPDTMLKSVKENTENANAQRLAQGIGALHVVGWMQKPAYDAPTKTVRWAIVNRQDGIVHPVINATALMLGRRGYEELVWVGPAKNYTPRGGLLDRVLAGDRFNLGARYQDHVAGDKLAGYGIAALVGTAAGATLYKVGAFGALLLLLKKLWIVVIAAIAGAWRWLTSKLKRTQFGPPAR